MSDDRGPRGELGAFLKARRSQLSPSDLGLPDDGTARRVPGLRRDEVARLASISTDYYTRLEQGRMQASATVLGSLIRALRLDESQQNYLYEIAGKGSARRRRRPAQRVRPSTQRLLDQLSTTPAMVLGRYNDILAWNAGAAALYEDFSLIPERQRNYTRLLFTSDAMRTLYVEWEAAARLGAATLRMEAARYPDDPRLAALVGELSVRSPDFRAWWADRVVSTTSYGTKLLRHPLVGDLTLDCDTWACPNDPEQRLMVLTAEPQTSSWDALQILASWHANPASAPAEE